MHVSDGVLSPAVCVGCGVLAAGAVGYSLHRLRTASATRTVPLTGMMAGLIFSGQGVNFPLFGLPVSGHLIGGVLAAVVLGADAGCVAITTVLFVQMALFADGGWLAFGANVFNMAVVSCWGGAAISSTIRKIWPTSTGQIAAAATAAWMSVVAASCAFAVEFALSHRGGDFRLGQIFGFMVGFHSLIGIGEALITVFVLQALFARRPDLLAHTETASVGKLRGVLVGGLVLTLLVIGCLTPFASTQRDGLEAVAERAGFDSLSRVTKSWWLSDYELPASWVAGLDPKSGFGLWVSVVTPYAVGTAVVTAAAAAVGWWAMRRPGVVSTQGTNHAA